MMSSFQTSYVQSHVLVHALSLSSLIFSINQLSSSSSFPSLQANKKEWFAQDPNLLITLIFAKKKSEQKYHQEPTNPATIAAVRLARTNVKKAIKKAQEKWIRMMINKQVNENRCMLTTSQHGSHQSFCWPIFHIIMSTPKTNTSKDGNLTVKPAD